MADPILTAIADHALALEAMNAGLELRNRLEVGLPPQRRRSDDAAIFETDDPRWIENEKNVSEVFDFELDAALELISIEPTTLDGAAKLIQYVSDLEARGHRWPDGKDRAVLLHRNLATMTGAASA